ncbi:MAG: ferrous iron transporter B [Candidatus Atribacteria bacterium]|nr:ferrous iron transporter B [Candidatus Atribacteria bacterium]
MKKVVLAGNPNVGKSVVFTRLSGVYAISSNYPGTTVEIARSMVKRDHSSFELIDAPGTYALEADAEAEKIAGKLIESADVVINVVDAGNLERNLYLTFELMEQRKPMILALNMWDEAKKRGIDINILKLSEILGIPVIPVVATTGEGMKKLVQSLDSAQVPVIIPGSHELRWKEIGQVIEAVQDFSYRQPCWVDRLKETTIQPVSGIIIGVGVLYGVFWLVRFIGESLITYLLDPLFYTWYFPFLLSLDRALSFSPFLRTVLVGQPVYGTINLEQSLGLLSTGVYVELGVVLPYIVSFYLILGLLEDTGYLPRLAVLLDGFLHRVGLHGYAIVPTLLGLGCNVPGVMATRVLESETERFIVTVLISVGVPCASQQALVFGVLGKYGTWPVLLVYGILFLVWLILGVILKYTVKGYRPALILEIPPYRLPYWKTILPKLWMRVKGFLREALPVVSLGILAINLLFMTNLFQIIARGLGPLMTTLFGLPKEVTLILALGFLRKDIAMSLLPPLGLSVKQLIISTVMLAMFFPCVATFMVIWKELGMKRLLQASGIMIGFSLLVGALLRVVL